MRYIVHTLRVSITHAFYKAVLVLQLVLLQPGRRHGERLQQQDLRTELSSIYGVHLSVSVLEHCRNMWCVRTVHVFVNMCL